MPRYNGDVKKISEILLNRPNGTPITGYPHDKLEGMWLINNNTIGVVFLFANELLKLKLKLKQH
ncbi:MAG: hypothetical protein JJV99_05975 [Colwellia sp.]|nr:hypothetical protein [Colwellia sp.]